MISKKGFTLSEVMIAVGLLGVLSAMLIPTITKITPSTSKVMFKKAYATLEKDVSSMINDDTNYPTDQTGTTTDTSTVVLKGFNDTSLPTGSTVPAGNNKFCYLFTQNLNLVTAVNCAVGTQWVFTSADGIVWTLTSNGFGLNATDFTTTYVTVDVNGAKSPNCSEDALASPVVSACVAPNLGKADTFRIGIRYDGKLQVPTTDATATTILSAPTDNQ